MKQVDLMITCLTRWAGDLFSTERLPHRSARCRAQLKEGLNGKYYGAAGLDLVTVIRPWFGQPRLSASYPDSARADVQ